ncbi:MAG: hypothetical protein ABR587_16265 [Candidatus Binatia bacterium]
MANRFTRTVLVIALGALLPNVAVADEPIRNWWRDARYNPNWGKPCEVRIDSKKHEYKREVRCPQGMEPAWRGNWKEEFRDGPCEVKLEATRYVFKEEVKCEGS